MSPSPTPTFGNALWRATLVGAGVYLGVLMLSLVWQAAAGQSPADLAIAVFKFVVPLFFAGLPIIAIGALLWTLVRRPRTVWADGRPRCAACGYELFGLSARRCPECGASQEPPAGPDAA